MTEPDLHTLTAARRTAILIPPPDLRAALGDRVAVLPLGVHLASTLVKGEPWEPDQTLAVAWASWYRLQNLGPGWALHADQGTPITVPAVNLRARVTAEEHGPRAVLEALALCVRFDLGADVWRRAFGGAERRRTRALKLGLRRQLLHVNDLDRNAARSFHLGDVIGVELHRDEEVPRWTGSDYELGGGAP